ncbi:MAG: glycosyltransferase [Pirellulales bacterium]
MTIKLLACSGSLDGGGSERQLWQLVSNLPEPDFCSQIFLVYKRGPYLDRLPSNIPVHAFSEVHRSSGGFRLPGSIHREQVAYVRQLIQEQKIQAVYDRTFHMTLITSKACRQVGCPRVSVIVSPPSLDFGGSNERFKWLKYRILRQAYSDPGAVTICVSQAVADDAAEYYQVPNNCFRVVESPVDISSVLRESQEPVHEQTVAYSKREKGTRKVLQVVVVGRMTTEKGHATMIEAVRAWNQLKDQPGWLPLGVDFLGDGPLQAELSRLAKAMGIEDQIRFRGFQSNPYPWIANADVVSIPSQYEGLPNVALESMALRRPVIATMCSSSLTRLIGPDNTRGQLVPVGDSVAIAQALLNFLRDEKRWEDRCQLAFNWVSSHHSLDSWIKVMATIFCDLATRK